MRLDSTECAHGAPLFEQLETRLLLGGSPPIALGDAYAVSEDGILSVVSVVPMAITVDPDTYPDGSPVADEAVISGAYPGVTLTALQTGVGTPVLTSSNVLAQADELASTGANVFGHTSWRTYESDKHEWGDGYQSWLRVDFANGATSVSLDFIADDSSDSNAVLKAFDASDNLLDTAASTGTHSTGQVVTLTVAAADIAYVQAEADVGGSSAWLLDNLVYMVSVSVTIDPDTYPDGSPVADEAVISGAYPGVTLTALQTGVGTPVLTSSNVLAQADELASTGANVFGHTSWRTYESDKHEWGDGYQSWLRVDFANGATSVSLDFIADDSSDSNAVLKAFDASDNLLDTAASTGTHSTGQVVTLTVAAADIAYVKAEPDLGGNSAWLLDHLVYENLQGPSGVLLNDSDPEGDALTAELVTDPLHGELTYFNANGTFEYTPDANFSGVDTFTYKAWDGESYSNVATVTITVSNLVDLSGQVFDDRDNDGLFDAGDGDAGVGGVNVQVWDESMTTMYASATTLADGSYFLNANLDAGTYKIVETQPAGYLDGDETVGNLGGSVDNTQDWQEIGEIEVGAPGTTADGVGYDFAELQPASLQGVVWEDLNDDGEVDLGELAIEGVAITLTGANDRVEAIEAVEQLTNAQGIFEFVNLRPGVYAVAEAQPADFLDGQDALGEVIELAPGVVEGGDGQVDPAGDAFAGIDLVAGASGVNYNFGERIEGGEVHTGQTAKVSFWQNGKGRALIRSLNGSEDSTILANWLAATFPNMYGSLAGMTNVEIAGFYKQLFKRHDKFGPGKPQRFDAQVLATALATFVTKESLVSLRYEGPTNDPTIDLTLIAPVEAYGFDVTAGGLGSASINIGDSGEAFDGFEDGEDVYVIDLLLATDRMSYDGVLYDDVDMDDDGNGEIDPDEALLRVLANDVYVAIGELGEM